MSVQAIKEFCGEVERVVALGAAGGRGDEALGRRIAALAPLGEKIPAIAKVIAIARKFQEGDEEPAKALLQLASAAAQLRGSQATAASVEGALEPLREASRDVASPVPIVTLYPLLEALASKRKPPEFIEQTLRDPSLAADARLWEPLVKSLSNPYLGPRSAELIGHIGTDVLPLVEAGFKKKGGAGDAAKLRAIAAVRKADAADLYRSCLRGASPEVQLAAVECLRYVSAQEMEDAAITLIVEVRETPQLELARILARAGTPKALDALAALGRRLPDLVALALDQLPADREADFLTRVRTQLDRGESEFGYSPELVQWLGDRHSPAALQLLREAMISSKLESDRTAAAEALLEKGDRASLEAVIAAATKDTSLAREQVRAYFLLGPAESFERLQPFFPALEPKQGGGLLKKAAALLTGKPEIEAPPAIPAQLDWAFDLINAKADRRWFEILAALARAGVGGAFRALLALEHEQSVPVLLECVERGGVGERLAVNALRRMHSAQVAEFLASRLGRAFEQKKAEVYLGALSEIGHPAALPGLNAFAQRQDLDKFTRDFTDAAIRACTRS